MRPIDIILLVISAFFTGLSYVIVKYGLEDFPPITLTAIRFIIAILLLMPFYMRKNLPWGKMIAMGFATALGFQVLAVTALDMGMDVATSVICQQMSVPFTSLLGVMVFKDALGMKRLIGLIIAFMGMIIVVGNPSIDESAFTPILLTVSAAFFYAIYNIMIKTTSEIHPFVILLATSIAALPILMILSYFVEDVNIEMIKNASLKAWLSVIYLSTLTTILAFGIWIKMLHKYSVHQIAPFALLVPVFGILSSSIILKEKLTIFTIIGGIITIMGIAIINTRRQDIITIYEKLRAKYLKLKGNYESN